MEKKVPKTYAYLKESEEETERFQHNKPYSFMYGSEPDKIEVWTKGKHSIELLAKFELITDLYHVYAP